MNAQRIYCPPGLLCEKCDRPLAFRQLPSGKWSPCDPDGSDHWDSCKAIQRKRMGLIKADGSVDWDKLKALDPPKESAHRPNITHVWASDSPPLDESLGEYRDFTKPEKQAGEVCVQWEDDGITGGMMVRPRARSTL